ncbi:LysE family transporter [Streptomyces sp. Ag109_O5-1]|uniref:LysE family translocator n=1 Tax=Streptomyces sp. Ag109_O5-1 TaxID=1938851 RepID=UPI000F516152
MGAQALREHRRGAPAPAADPPGPTAGSARRTGLLCNLFNPKIAVFYTGLLPALAPPGWPAAWAMALLVLLHVGLTLVWLGCYVLLASRARHVLERPEVRRTLGRATGVVLIGFGVLLAVAA